MAQYDFQRQKNEWRKKGWSIPDFRGGKQSWFLLLKGLIELIGNNQANDLDATPQIDGFDGLLSWRSYAPFLKGMGLVSNQAGLLCLTAIGISFQKEPTEINLANIIQDKTRLFGEILNYLNTESATVEEIDKLLCEEYNLNWNGLSNTRRRMDWLEVLGLIQGIGNRKWEITESGREALSKWCIVRPKAIGAQISDLNSIEIAEPPAEIAILLQRLQESPELHKRRSTYNIWAPSPNRINNLRVIIQYASDRITKSELFGYVEKEFNLKTSTVESMLPFLKAAGFIEEVGRNIYLATPAAKAWINTGEDLDFIRILHAHMKFVGEMIKAAEEDIVRNDVYALSKDYGLNTEKARWITGFLIEAGLLEEPQYLHLKATPIGKSFISKLPLEDLSAPYSDEKEETKEALPQIVPEEIDRITARLYNAARDPSAEGKASGVAFEEAIAEMFDFMGFEAKRIGGSGDTDVVVRWKDAEGKSITAIVDGKSKSSGLVSHTDVSDVALDTHKDKNGAEYVAIVGPGFSGDTIRNHAKKKLFALITDSELSEIARLSQSLGLSLQEIALVFQVPNGLSQLAELMSSKQRELAIVSSVLSIFRKEQDELEGLSPRDLFLLLRHTDDSPSLEELINVFETLSRPEIGVLVATNTTKFPQNVVYILNEGKKAANRLRALASAIEKGIKN